MPALDIFSSDAFSVISLTDAINKMPFIPGKVGQLGIFQETGVATTSVMIEEREGSLALIPTSPRGGPPAQNKHNKPGTPRSAAQTNSASHHRGG